jgi:hypothetical protein
MHTYMQFSMRCSLNVFATQTAVTQDSVATLKKQIGSHLDHDDGASIGVKQWLHARHHSVQPAGCMGHVDGITAAEGHGSPAIDL